jgi:hypothetical protein
VHLNFHGTCLPFLPLTICMLLKSMTDKQAK